MFCSVEAEVSISVAVPKLMESLTRILWVEVSLILHFAVNAFLFFLSGICLWKIGLAYDPGSLVCLGERNELENNYCDV